MGGGWRLPRVRRDLVALADATRASWRRSPNDSVPVVDCREFQAAAFPERLVKSASRNNMLG